MTTPKLSRAEWRQRLRAADLAIESRGEATASARDDMDSQQWLAVAENKRTLLETEALLRSVSRLPRPPIIVIGPHRPLIHSTPFKAAAGIAAVGIICSLLALLLMFDGGQHLVTEQTQWHTGKLKDASGVVMGPGTDLSFQVNASERQVTFKHGQALFEVKKSTKPFVVTTDAGRVVAVGTEFAVTQLDGPPEVTVKKGMVRVEPLQGQPVLVGRDQQLTLVAGGPLTPREVDIDKQLKWVERLWNFDGKTVTQVVTELNRHNDLKIDFDESALRADTIIYGTLKLDDPMSFAQWLTADRNLVIDRRQPNVLQLTAAKPGAL